MSFILTFILGMLIDFYFIKRPVFLGKEELQDYINEETNILIDLFKRNGFKINQSDITSTLWIQCKKLGDFILLAKEVYKVDTIYLYWKTDFLKQPVFYILQGKTTIIYEPF